ncbi:diaminohydroxyphosphoribosylamino-pyrimidine deaminase [Hygrophoropsis aurantiaca]|uniref:Diaminohydroxyphosphoribosylamino-pyrimidine deaminase n=1 Tax=Hygrophoropsis aurantiaca TaxID=72124 RepID=A0ACB8AAW6_9AGAM|nr:diaminohydroxyphosphoribosylamino-pyrimidine deaminase [Hygrophoropsis aurantiaca]
MSIDDISYPEHTRHIECALEEAQKCEPVSTAFCVGCVLVTRWPGTIPIILSRGYSRELPGNTHAEANALSKAQSLLISDIGALLPNITPPPTAETIFAHTDVYTTLEPCSVRTSGLAPCADAIIASKIKRCIIGVGEPDDFVKCEGAQKLKNAGIEVIWVKGLEEKCLKEARRGHD